MKQITEDYCNEEISVLLKEKGFDEKTLSYYQDNVLCHGDWFEWNRSPFRHIAAPTHQMALKWLMEVHKIIISFNASFVSSIEQHFSWNIRINSLKSLNDEEHFEPIYINAKSESFKEACDAALLYVLKNLI